MVSALASKMAAAGSQMGERGATAQLEEGIVMAGTKVAILGTGIFSRF
jgi:hypothetical protein